MAFALSEMQVTSSSFEAGAPIARQYSHEGEDISPALAWSGAPEGTQSYAVFCHDPDAPLIQNGAYGFVHWVLYNLPASVTSLDENTSQGTAGATDFGSNGYGGPMPPENHGVHNYYFWVLALDKELDLPAGLPLPELLNKVEPHLLGANRIFGTYQRG